MGARKIRELLPDHGPLSAAMERLAPQHREFVRALFLVIPGKGQLVRAAKLCGHYGGPQTKPGTWQAIASRLAARKDVSEAIKEQGQLHFAAIGPAAVQSLRAMVETPSHRHHFRAVAFVVERGIAPLATTHDVTVHHELPDIALTASVVQRIQDIARRLGVAMPPLIEGEVIEAIEVAPASEQLQ